MRAKDSELSGYLAFALCSALNFTRRDGNAEFANGDDAVKFTEFYVKAGIVGGENL
ncbi:hypothetical protein [Campylobacter showae]|uniref:hypothetical protein n=1 Tax=Campylobacter showae TaxID=204 RepID=UPI0028D516BB|nr:hypothetical protein [Campylobacter showae]